MENYLKNVNKTDTQVPRKRCLANNCQPTDQHEKKNQYNTIVVDNTSICFDNNRTEPNIVENVI